ncbi:reverse ribonuclease [Labeo rohita]|uniref:Gypsy retrotransposon integrase-like protein 1 n=1 Tax=Labeo rohita TaxID=84645 RepID=A0A498NC52_LABRO|nr:reverse ribonuclease [Labeo rohita]
MQKDDVGRDVAVAFASRTLHKAERLYSTPEKEYLGVIWGLEHFIPYIEGLHVTIYTDHNSLRWLMNRPNPSGRLARWSLRLQDFDFSIVHKPGVQNNVPDALSRSPLLHSAGPIDILPAHAVIGGLDLRSLSSVMITDREQLKQLQEDDPVVGNLIRNLEGDGMDEEHVVQDGLLYYKDPKVTCGLHPMKQLKLFLPTVVRPTVLKYYHDHPTAGHLGVTKTLARLRQRKRKNVIEQIQLHDKVLDVCVCMCLWCISESSLNLPVTSS